MRCVCLLLACRRRVVAGGGRARDTRVLRHVNGRRRRRTARKRARVGRCVLAFSATLFYLFLCSSCSVLVLCSAGALLRSFPFPVSPPARVPHPPPRPRSPRPLVQPTTSSNATRLNARFRTCRFVCNVMFRSLLFGRAPVPPLPSPPSYFCSLLLGHTR